MRSSFDKVIAWTGIVVAVVLLFAGGLLVWASSFATSNVHDQLKAQQITMPAAAALTTPQMKAQLSQYAGQDMTTGAQAKAYADYYIQEHMNAQADGKTYSQVSSEYMAASKADPTAQATQDLGALRQTLFMGTTLRGMLLNAAAFAGSALMFVLGALGIRHAHKTEAKATVAPAIKQIPATV